MLGLGERYNQHVGKRYVIRARLSWSDPNDDEDEATVWIYGLVAGPDEKGHSRDRTMVATHALDSYQREFLSRHCWSTYLGKATSLCEGKIYLEIKRDPRLPVIRAELLGADFEEADDKTFLQYIQGIQRTPGTRR
jgi:hypothetical protein